MLFGASQHIKNGGIADETTVSSGGWQFIHSGGIGAGTKVITGGSQHVEDGGIVTSASIAGSQTVSSGGVISSSTISAGGNQSIYSGGSATDTVVSNGGLQDVLNEGVAIGTLLYGTQNVSNGKVLETQIKNGGNQILQWGGSATDTTVSNGGLQYISRGGFASNTEIQTGGSQTVGYMGIAVKTKVASGATQTIEWLGAASNTTIAEGGTLDVHSGGQTTGVIIKTNATANVALGATNTGAQVTGTLNVAGTTTETTVRKGALLSATGSVQNSDVEYGGEMQLAKNASLEGDITLAGSLKATGAVGLTNVNFTLDVSDRSTSDDYIINDYAQLGTADSWTIVVDNDQSLGTYKLAGNATGFDSSITIKNTSGSSLGSLSLNAAALISGSTKYALALDQDNGMNLTLSTNSSGSPTINVTALGASVPSGTTAATGKWIYNFGTDVPTAKTVTIGDKSLNMAKTTNTVAVAGTYGTLTVKADGTYSYAAKANASGPDSFTFKITDADGDSATATLNVTAVDQTAPTVSKITGKANAIGATMTFSEKMNATTLKSSLKVTLTGIGSTMKPTSVKETNATSHTYSATFGATNYVGAYKLTLGTGAKDVAGNALGKDILTNVSTMTVTSKTIAAGKSQNVYGGGIASASVVKGTQAVFTGGKVLGSLVKAGGKLTLNAGTATGAKVSGTSKSAGTMSIGSGIASNTTVQAYGALTMNGGTAKKVTVQKNGSLTLTKGTVKALTLASGGKVQINGGKLVGTTTLNGGTVTVAATGVKVGKITAKTAAVVKYDVSAVKPGAKTAMLVRGTKQALNTGYGIVTAKLQKMGAYKLSSKLTVAKGKEFGLFQGTSKIGAATLGTAKELNGVSYKVAQSKGIVTLKLAAVAGEILPGTAKKDTLTGTANCDIFYGGKGNDTIKGMGGRDVAVYDKTAWGKDTIAATKGTMTLVLQDIKKTQVTTKLSKGTMVIKRKGTSQSITVKGWSADTHNIVYNVAAADLKAFTNYRNAASPTATQEKNARNAVWQKAGLASA